MKKFVLSLSTALVVAAASAAPATAGSWQKFKSTVTAPVTSPVNVEVVYSEDMIHRANNLPKKLSDRGNIRGLNDGFGGNGFYGERDLEKLRVNLQNKALKQLSKRGIPVSATAAQTLRITIVEAKPSRPTFEQMSRQPSLSYSSFGRGGATLEAELISTSGESQGTMVYGWYEDDIREAQFSGTWTDTKRAFGRFAKRAAKDLAR